MLDLRTLGLLRIFENAMPYIHLHPIYIIIYTYYIYIYTYYTYIYNDILQKHLYTSLAYRNLNVSLTNHVAFLRLVSSIGIQGSRDPSQALDVLRDFLRERPDEVMGVALFNRKPPYRKT
jgi:hypothetical protein